MYVFTKYSLNFIHYNHPAMFADLIDFQWTTSPRNSSTSKVIPISSLLLYLSSNVSPSAYLYKTQGSTHHLNLKVEEIFRVTRSSEEDRWQASGMSNLTNLGDNRKLLWHGSRTTNFSGILSQGLRIAPPEAPVNGYMFDKGIYLADIATKSANYCCAYNSGNTGLLLLCEAQLGDPMLELTGADYHAATNCKKAGKLATKGLGLTAPKTWEDAGVVNDNLKGVMMPKVTGNEKNITGPSGVNNAYLQYNEVCCPPPIVCVCVHASEC